MRMINDKLTKITTLQDDYFFEMIDGSIICLKPRLLETIKYEWNLDGKILDVHFNDRRYVAVEFEDEKNDQKYGFIIALDTMEIVNEFDPYIKNDYKGMLPKKIKL